MHETTPPLLDRKELARLRNIPPDQVGANEERLGILPFRVTINKRVVRYHRVASIKALEAKKILPACNLP